MSARVCACVRTCGGSKKSPRLLPDAKVASRSATQAWRPSGDVTRMRSAGAGGPGHRRSGSRLVENRDHFEAPAPYTRCGVAEHFRVDVVTLRSESVLMICGQRPSGTVAKATARSV